MHSYHGCLIYRTAERVLFREVGGKEKKNPNISYTVTWFGMYTYDYVKSVSGWLFVLSCRVFCAHWVGGSHCETNKDRAASPSTTLWRLAPATPQHYSSVVQAFSVLLGGHTNKKIKGKPLVICSQLSKRATLTSYTIPGLFCFWFPKLSFKFIIANINYVLYKNDAYRKFLTYCNQPVL